MTIIAVLFQISPFWLFLKRGKVILHSNNTEIVSRFWIRLNQWELSRSSWKRASGILDCRPLYSTRKYSRGLLATLALSFAPCYHENMRLNQDQLNLLAKYLADFSKILIASAVVGFFVPTGAGQVTIPVFIIGAFIAVLSLWTSVNLLK